MPYDKADPQDPMMLVGVELEGGPDSLRKMASVFAEEFARLGFNSEIILTIFRNPFYAAAHRALAELGEEEIRRLVSEATDVWGRVRPVDRDATAPLWSPKGGL